jgi:5-methylthioadenosine/S-adenosylhomocysteine deaminase
VGGGSFPSDLPASLRADHVVTVSGPTWSPGHVVVLGGRFRAVGKDAPPDGAAMFDLGPGSIVIPGLVSAHTHLALGDFKGCADDRPFLDWLTQGLLPEIQAASPERFRRGALQSARELLAGGVTLVGDNFFRGDGIDAAVLTGQRIAFFQEVFGSLAPDEDAHWRDAEATLAEVEARHGAALSGYSPHTPWTCPPATFRRVVARARATGRRLSFHLDESREEHEFFTEAGGPIAEMMARRGTGGRYPAGMTPTALVNELGGLGRSTVAAHAVHVTPADIALLRATGCGVVHCPRSNMKLAEGIAPVAAMLDAGVTVALGVDSAASNTRLDIFAEMRAALEVQRAATGRIGPMTAARVLEMATRSGAEVLGLGAETGTLEAGKLADFVVIDAGRERHGRISDPIATVVHACGPEDVALVVIGGEIRHRRGV